MEYPGRLIAGLIAVILIVLFPLQYIAQINSENIDAVVSDETKELVDNIRNKGYIDRDMYEDYLAFLNQTGELYDIELEDIHPVTGEELPVIGEADEFKENHFMDLCSYSKHTPSAAGKNHILNLSSGSSHTHSAACYPGTLHECNGTDCDYEGKEVWVQSRAANMGSSGQGLLQYSFDKGVTWTTAIELNTDAAFTALTYAYGNFYAFASNGDMYYGTDGISWTRIQNIINSKTVRRVAYRNGILYAITNNSRSINYSGTGYSVYTSKDGLNWTCTQSNVVIDHTTSSLGALKVVNDVIFIFNTGSYRLYYIKPNESQITTTIANGYTYIGKYTDIAYLDGVYYALNYYNIWTSSDLINWSEYNFSDLSYAGRFLGWGISNFITYANSLYVLGSGEAMIKESSYGNYVGYYVKAFYLRKLSSLPESSATYSKLGYLYNGSEHYIYYSSGLNSTTICSTKDFIGWSQVTTSTLTGSNMICNADGGSGPIDLGLCKKKGKYYDDNGNEVSPICDRVVTAITAVKPNQTVFQGDGIDTTAYATFLDGHVSTVNCTATGYNPNTIGTQIVTLTYTGLINNARTTGQITCKITVEVVSRKNLISISATPVLQTIDRYSSPVFTVIAYYSDGSSTVLSDGKYIISGFDSSKTGSQTVTISYTENSITKSCTVIVNVNGLTSISVAPTILTVERYTPASSLPFTVTASYLFGSNKEVTSGYAIIGYQPSLLGQQTVTVSYIELGITKTAAAIINVTVLHKECPICRNTYDLGTDDFDPGCPFCKQLITGIIVTPENVLATAGESLPISVEAVYKSGDIRKIFGWTSNYNPYKIGTQTVTVEYGGCSAEITVNVKEAMLTCQKCGTQYPASIGVCPVCSENVISISVAPSTVTVKQHENIDITVIANFADGSSRIVYDWTIDRSSAKAGRYKATVTYRTASADIELIVIGITDEECPICGNIYDMVENPNGCPICFTTLIGIEAYLLNGINKVQYGTKPDIAIVLIFRDEHREIVTDGYTVENFNPYRLGTQTIMIKYRGFSISLTVEVVNMLSTVICPNGHVYFLNEDGTDPGCPYCRPDSSSKTTYYFDITYSSDIFNKVYATGAYYFRKCNFVTIKVIKRDKSLLYKLQKMFFKTTMLGRRKVFIFGGEVN